MFWEDHSPATSVQDVRTPGGGGGDLPGGGGGDLPGGGGGDLPGGGGGDFCKAQHGTINPKLTENAFEGCSVSRNCQRKSTVL